MDSDGVRIEFGASRPLDCGDRLVCRDCIGPHVGALLSAPEHKALDALAKNGTGRIDPRFWCTEHGASQRVRNRLKALGLAWWAPGSRMWEITEAGKALAESEMTDG